MKERICMKQIIKGMLPPELYYKTDRWDQYIFKKKDFIIDTERKIAHIYVFYDVHMTVYDKQYYNIIKDIAKKIEKNKAWKYSEIELIKCWEGADK